MANHIQMSISIPNKHQQQQSDNICIGDDYEPIYNKKYE